MGILSPGFTVCWIITSVAHLKWCLALGFVLQVRSQGVTEELKCLSLLNALDKDQDIPDQLAQLFGEPCIKLAEGIKAYISKVRGSLS